MVRIIRTGPNHNGTPLSCRSEHLSYGRNKWAERVVKPARKKHKNHRKGKMPNLRGGGR